jgi:hypothetical protein
VVTGKHPLESLEWGEFEPPTQLTRTSIEEQTKKLKEADGGDIITFGSPYTCTISYQCRARR